MNGRFQIALNGVDLGDDAFDGLDLVGRRDAHGGRAELAAEGAAALSLNSEAVVAFDVEEVEAGHRGVGEVEVVAAGIVDGLEIAGEEVGNDGRPEGFAFADDDGVGVAEGFEGEGADVESAEDDASAEGAIAVGQSVGFEDLGGEAGDGDGVELFRNAGDIGEICNLKVADLYVARGESGEGEKTEAGERGDDLAALDEAGKSEAEDISSALRTRTPLIAIRPSFIEANLRSELRECPSRRRGREWGTGAGEACAMRRGNSRGAW